MKAWTYILALWSTTAAFLLPFIAAAAACNPDTQFCGFSRFSNLKDFIISSLKVVVTISLPVIVFFIVLSGLYFVMARGNPEQLKKAKMNFVYVIAGTALILGAWVLATILGATFLQIVGG